MLKQIKKGLSIFAVVVSSISLMTVQAAPIAKSVSMISRSDVADQKSVIDEQNVVNKIENDTTDIDIWKLEQKEEKERIEREKAHIEQLLKEQAELKNPYRKIIENFTEDDKKLIYNITFAEAGNQDIAGQRAVIEVILNRILSDKFPNTLTGVLSASGQFSTWRVRNRVNSNTEQKIALNQVYEEEPILETVDYVYFSRGRNSYATNHVKIQDHWFGETRN